MMEMFNPFIISVIGTKVGQLYNHIKKVNMCMCINCILIYLNIY